MRSFRYITLGIMLLLFQPELGAQLSIQSSFSGPRYQIPGFVRINDTLFASISEVTIREYGMFLVQLMQRDTVLLKQALPIDNGFQWCFTEKGESSYIDKIYEIRDARILYPAWTWSYPVVNVTREQANMYCLEVTNAYNSYTKTLPPRIARKRPPDVHFRLPTESEWMAIAAAGFDPDEHPLGVPGVKKDAPAPVSVEFLKRYEGDERHPYGSQGSWKNGLRNRLGIYNMPGNVWELVADSDNVMGGSFDETADRCHVTATRKCKGPADNVGFRMVAVIRAARNVE